MFAACRAGRRLLSNVRFQSPTLLYCPGLLAKPWWDEGAADDLGGQPGEVLLSQLRAALEPEAAAIAEEYRQLAAARSAALQAGVGSGSWASFYLWNQGVEDSSVLRDCPATARALACLKPGLLIRGCALGYAFFSTLAPGTTIKPHCGATNLRLRAHLGLDVPAPRGVPAAVRPQITSFGASTCSAPKPCSAATLWGWWGVVAVVTGGGTYGGWWWARVRLCTCAWCLHLVNLECTAHDGGCLAVTGKGQPTDESSWRVARLEGGEDHGLR